MKDVSYPVAWSESVRHVNPKVQAQSAQTSIQKIYSFVSLQVSADRFHHLMILPSLSHLSTGPADLFAACDGSSRDHGLPRNGRSPGACLN